MPIKNAPSLSAAFAASALTLGSAMAQADELPPLDEFTEIAFEMVDIGFCLMHEGTDDETRALIAEIDGNTPLQGMASGPQQAPIYGDGYFTRGDDDTAIAASMQAFLIPEDGAITQLCLVLLPMDSPGATEGSFALKGFEEFAEATAPEPSYVLLGQHMGRDGQGEEIKLADLAQGAGHVAFAADEGEFLTIDIGFEGALSDGTPVQIAFDVELMEAEDVRFMNMWTP